MRRKVAVLLGVLAGLALLVLLGLGVTAVMGTPKVTVTTCQVSPTIPGHPCPPGGP